MVVKKKMILLSAVVLLVGLTAFGMTATAARDTTAKGINVQELARVGIQLNTPLTAPGLTEAQVREAAKKELPVYTQQASSITVQRVMYGSPESTTKQPAWMVTLEGLNIASRGPKGIPQTVNTQMLLIIDESGQRLISYTYQ
jgi:hypothetical protein